MHEQVLLLHLVLFLLLLINNTEGTKFNKTDSIPNKSKYSRYGSCTYRVLALAVILTSKES